MNYDPMQDPKAIPDSYWAATAEPAAEIESLHASDEAEIVVIGAGFTGLSTALHLAERGKNVLVLDANEPGWGASGRNNGQVVAALKHEPHKIEAKFGKLRGQRLIDFVGKGPDLVFSLIDRYGISCNATRNGIITAAHSKKSLESLERRTEIWVGRGAPLSMMSRDDVAAQVGTPYYFGANFDPRGGALNPLGYARGLARAAIANGAKIRKDAYVRKIVREGSRWVVCLDGLNVKADKIVIATNGYTGNFWPGLKKAIVPTRTPQIVSAPLSESLRRSILPGLQSMSDTRRLTLGVRMHPDGRLHMGGGGGTSGADRAGPYENLEKFAKMLFPHLPELQWEYKWTGFMAMTPDKYPRLFELAPNVVAMYGYSGRGLAMATLIGGELARWASDEARSDDLALPRAKFRQLPYYAIKDILVEAALVYYAARDKLDHVKAGR